MNITIYKIIPNEKKSILKYKYNLIYNYISLKFKTRVFNFTIVIILLTDFRLTNLHYTVLQNIIHL